MRLAAFIRSNIEQISAEWELFAATLLPEEEFSASVLRDGIVDMLNEIAADMDRAQSAEQQQGKSEGAPRRNQHIEDAAERHALARVKMGLSARQVISEFRALRATVIRLWQSEVIEIGVASLYDLTRFNESIDQALTEAAVRYSEEIDRSRELFLGILGHDLRNPLGAISGFAELQLRSKTPDRNGHFASQILICAGRMSHMITDLIELTRVRLGAGILIKPTHTCMRRICANVIEEMKAIYPKRTFQLNCDDELPGEWDEPRMSQVLSNLLGNAVQHGDVKSPISVTAKRDENGEVELSVHNEGTPIPPKMIPKLFDCLFQGSSDQRAADDNSTSLGLGLYIAKEIISAHGGTIEVQSSDGEGTTFAVRLPHVSFK
ncbi:MAG TPA: HAMP domain-containing sensor histidine kinase [Acidobacteriaceae bacterium]|jgi:signal transduction histidine kinase